MWIWSLTVLSDARTHMNHQASSISCDWDRIPLTAEMSLWRRLAFTLAAFAIYFAVFPFLAAEFGDRASYASILPATIAVMALGAPRQLGAFGYLTKPWSPSELLERVRWVLVSARKTAA